MIKTQTIAYQSNGDSFEGFYAYDDQTPTKKPVILIAHDWSGKNEFAHQKAIEIANLGYIGFALDMYGNGKIGKTKEEKTALIQPLLQNRALLIERMQTALKEAQTIDIADSKKVGAIGFCFGGLCVLDLARSGVDIKGVVSFHGLLNAPEHIQAQMIKAKILVLHGYEDPMVSFEAVHHFSKEMTTAKADWQVVVYGNTMHSFTNPEANDPVFGTVYNSLSATRSFTAMKDFFKEIF